MDTVTYPTAAVQSALEEHTIPAHFNLHEPTDQTKQLLRRFRVVWTPTLVFLDHHEIELRRLVGYVPPGDFPAEVDMAIGMAHVMHAQYDEAFRRFRGVVESHPGAEAVPEALYWAGVAALRRDGAADGLVEQWRELQAKYPQSVWWKRASFIDR